jgi:hypothetical protein
MVSFMAPRRTRSSLQKDALAAVGGALVIVQMAERMIKLCMQFVVQKGDGALTYEKLKSQQADEAKRTLGYFLGQLRQRVEVEASFDDRLREFLEMRNQLAHDLSEVAGLGFSEPKELEFAVEWAGKLSGLALQVHNVFMGLARAWQHQIGMRDDFAEDEFFREIDTKFKPLAEQLFAAKPPPAARAAFRTRILHRKSAKDSSS